jgi:adenosylcobyric acid synthase
MTATRPGQDEPRLAGTDPGARGGTGVGGAIVDATGDGPIGNDGPPAAGAHGGDGAAVAAWLGVDPAAVLDLSASMNPWAPDVRPAVARAVEGGALARYPDDRAATEALARTIGVEPDTVVLTNGGAEAIALVAARWPEGWVEEPEFSLYRRHLRAVVPGAPRWRSNPGNPSGLLAPAEARAAVWDEAFLPLATGRWTRGDVAAGSVVVGSLTKLWACPGLRIGYILAPDADVAADLRRRRPQWAVNGIGCAVLPWLLDRSDLPGWHRSLVAARQHLADVLRAAGFSPRPSDANWLLVDGADGLRKALARRGVVVRDCTSFGMPGTVRVAVPGDAGLERLAGALADVAGRPSPAPVQGRAPEPTRPWWSGLRGAIVVCGTGSDVGKSALVAGLCRALARRGVAVAPFKAQNMALNSGVTEDGAEIGRAQLAQAEAAGVPAEWRMNPILLKPTGERRSQVVVAGRPWAVMDVAGYRGARRELATVALDALADLRRRFDVVVCEGAGSPAEINLLDGDFVNLGLAERAGAAAIVVGDIDRGGVFAALYGTVAVLPPHLAGRVRGFVVNKFRGDPVLLEPGLAELRARTGVPVLGVVPWLGDLSVDAEDSLALDRLAVGPARTSAEVDVAVVRLPHLSNATDIDALAAHPGVAVRLVDRPEDLGQPDLVLLPGTKATVADLGWLRSRGLSTAIQGVLGPSGPVVVAVCGGYQMAGTFIDDEVESGVGTVAGLGWLPVVTVFGPDKVTRRRTGSVAPWVRELGATVPAVEGYEIRHGRPMPLARAAGGGSGAAAPLSGGSEAGRSVVAAPGPGGSGAAALGPGGAWSGSDGVGPWLLLDDGGTPEAEGMADPARGVLGTSLHGLFECDELRQRVLTWARRRRGRRPPPAFDRPFASVRAERLDRLADAVERHVDMAAVARLIATARPVRAGSPDAAAEEAP